MALIKQYRKHLFNDDKEPLLRYDQYVGSDSQQYRDKLSEEAASVAREASRKGLSLDLSMTELGPAPRWCEEIIATVSLQLWRTSAC